MKASLRSRLERLENRTEARRSPDFLYGWIRMLPADYLGERHTVIVKREPTGSPHVLWCQFAERPGPAPDGDSDDGFVVCLTPEYIFLCSLAEATGQRAVAVILSGLDGDGSAALKAIKAAGGLTFAQSDASFDSMPRHAVETGHIDYLLPATEIAKALLALAHEPLRAT